MTRPATLALVAGTGTEVGKTWTACRLSETLRSQGLTVTARKPAQSYDPSDPTTDADLLAVATGDDPDHVCLPHRSYPVAMAPFMAADALGRPPILLADLLAELTWPDPVDLGLVEAAGGVRSPITTDGADTLDLATALDPDITLLVADAGLGVINAVRLSLDALARPGTIVFLNHYDQTSDLHRRNRAWLQQGTPADIASTIDELGDLVGALLWPRRRAVRTAKGPSGRLGSTQDQGGRHHAEVRDRAGPARSRRPDE